METNALPGSPRRRNVADITPINEVSRNSENLLEDEDKDLENGCDELFEIEGDRDNDRDREGKTDRYFDTESNGHEDGGDDENEQLFDIEGNGCENDGIETNEPFYVIEEDDAREEMKDDPSVADSRGGVLDGKIYPQPVVCMEFESYSDAYDFYNSYAKEIGFAIRVKSSWTKRNSKEKRGAVLCCNCEGFKTVKEVNSRRKETRTGCLAMIRLRLVESSRWRIDEVKLEHNHLFDPERAQNSKSHKRIDLGTKRKEELALDVEVRTIKLYRRPAVDSVGCGSSSSCVGDRNSRSNWSRDSKIVNGFFRKAQLTDPNFFYVMDFGDEGNLKNVFWIDSRSRAAYGYFGDVVSFNTTCLSYNYKIPLVEFVGVNHHGQSILFGSGLLVDESLETYVWLLRAWLTCLCGRPPQTIITRQCKALQSAISEVFPRAHHRLCLSNVIQTILDGLRGLQEYEAFRIVLIRIMYESLKADEFELAWENMTQRFGVSDLDWLRFLYEDRERWAPVYSKDTFFAGMPSFQKGEPMISVFHRYIHNKTSFAEFFDIHDSILEKTRQREALDNLESRDSSLILRTRSYFELQVSQLYTKDIFAKFQEEVASTSCCLNITQVQSSGSVTAYMVKDRDSNSFEVMFDKAGSEVRCICGCFNFNGYLCRHALCVLSYNGVEEIPFQYILSRWRKDFKRMYVPDLGSNNIDVSNQVQWFDHLYRRAMQVVEQGINSQDHYMVAWQSFKESLNKVRLVSDKHV